MPTLSPQDFVAKWRRATLKERSAAQSHFNDVCALLGQPVVGDASGGSVTLHAGYWPCSLSAAVSGVVATKLTSTDVQLTWSGKGVFDVWRGASPYYAPGATGSLQIGDDVTSPFDAAGVLGNPAINYTFLVLAQNGCGASGPSNRTAEFDFSLTPVSP